jgi:hypothetical protein
MAIIEAEKTEPNHSELAREFSKKWGFEVKRPTVISILSAKESIEAAINAGARAKRKKLPLSYEPKLDDAVLKWLKQARSQNLQISGDLIR